jgi:CheY-like chemotaxis protein
MRIPSNVRGTVFSPAAAQGGTGMSATKKILVVDDEESMRLLIQRLVESIPAAEVTLADGPDQALKHLGESRYDLVLLDLLMPVEGGIQVLTRLRGMPNNRSTPVIIVSLVADQETRNVCQALGVNDYIAKPFDRNVLLQAVRKQLGSAPQG